MRVEEDPILEKMEKKSKKSKKNKTSDFQEVASDLATDVKSDEVVDRKGYVEVDGDLQKEKGQKQKKKKSKSSEGFEMDASSTVVTVSANLSEEDKKKRKNKKNDHGGKIVVDRVHDEAHEKGNFKVDDEVQKEKDRKKKRKSNKSSEEVITEMRNSEEFTKSRKITRGEKGDKDRDSQGEKKIEDGESRASSEARTDEKMEKKMKRKREKKKENNALDVGSQETVTEESDKVGSVLPKKGFVDGESDGPLTLSKTKDGEDKEGSKGKKKKKKKTNAAENSSEDPQPKRKAKKVSFSSDVEVFPSVVRGKRFSRVEDEILKEAVLNYIKAHGLGEEGLNMVMHCKSHAEIKNCWKEIGAAIPYRPVSAIYYRAHILFERADTRKWTEEDYEFVRKAQQQHGNDWKSIAEELGKHRFHVKDTWRRIKLQNRKKGQWSQEEYQTLYDLVNMDLQMKLDAEEKKSKHGMLRDNIPWGAISERLSTRSDAHCCTKWYKQLTSSMVAEGLWADADDYRLVGALYNLDACCEGDVDWDNLLGHRSGDVCQKRWNQMVLHIGHHGCKPFAEQVETLAQRYCPDLAETREAWDSKPVTP